MAKDIQIKKVLMEITKGSKIEIASLRAGVCAKTARKYLRLGKLPSEVRKPHTWKTREDPFQEVWSEVAELITAYPELLSTTILSHLQGKYPAKFHQGQLRSLQRKISLYRKLNKIPKQVYFSQIHYPGIMSESDYTDMAECGITIAGSKFTHLVYHFVLTYSNWETGIICFTESFESYSEGLQKALWCLGKVPLSTKTDCLSAVVKKNKDFTDRCKALLNHYNIEGSHTQPASPHENGDVEQGNYRLKQSIKQALMIRGTSDFASIDEYNTFLQKMFVTLNEPRHAKLDEELEVMQPLPEKRLSTEKMLISRVSKGSTIRVNNNVYSVHSSLIGEKVIVKMFVATIEVWYAGKLMETIPRLAGSKKHYINYRHIIDWLVRKPGAFLNYCYHNDLYPTTYFRLAYDTLKKDSPLHAVKDYLRLLLLAKNVGESNVENAIRFLMEKNYPVAYLVVEKLVQSSDNLPSKTEVNITLPNLSVYDGLLTTYSDKGESYVK